MLEEIEAIPLVPELPEEVPFVWNAFRADLVAPAHGKEYEGPELEFIYDGEVDQEEMATGEEQAWTCIEIFKV